MTYDAKAGDERARRFRDAALPYIDDAYTLAYFLMHDQADAGDAVQQCYLRALGRFDSLRAPATKTWLLTILRGLCYAKLARQRHEKPADPGDREHVAEQPWPRSKVPLHSATLSRQNGTAIRQLVAALPMPLREAVVLHEFNGLSYREIAEVVSVPVGTVMARLAQARAILLGAWKATDKPWLPEPRRPRPCEYAGATGAIAPGSP